MKQFNQNLKWARANSVAMCISVWLITIIQRFHTSIFFPSNFASYRIFPFQNINSLDEDCLKHLLEEAISYKGPKDKENKSETFKVRREHMPLRHFCQSIYATNVLAGVKFNWPRCCWCASMVVVVVVFLYAQKLLQTVEQEDKERTGAFLSARQYRGNSRRHGYPNRYILIDFIPLQFN